MRDLAVGIDTEKNRLTLRDTRVNSVGVEWHYLAKIDLTPAITKEIDETFKRMDRAHEKLADKQHPR